MGSDSTASWIKYIDNGLAYFIYGAIVQFCLLYVANIWLAILALPTVVALSHTYLFSLYLSLALSHLKPVASQETLVSICQDLKHSFIEQDPITRLYHSLMHTHIPADTTLNATHAIKCLLYLILLYHAPAAIGITATYFILCLSYGKNITRKIINVPILMLCSLYAFVLPLPLIFIPISIALSAYLFVEFFPGENKTANESLINTIHTKLNASVDVLISSYSACTNLVDQLLYQLLLIALALPILQIIPVLCHLALFFTNPAIMLAQFCMATGILGYKISCFLQQDIPISTAKPSAPAQQDIPVNTAQPSATAPQDIPVATIIRQLHATIEHLSQKP